MHANADVISDLKLVGHHGNIYPSEVRSIRCQSSLSPPWPVLVRFLRPRSLDSTTLAYTSAVTAQSCAGGAGFCDGSGHCQDGSGVVSPNVDPDCVGRGATRGGRGGAAAAGNNANDGNGGNGANNANGGNGASPGANINQGGPCAGGAGFCDGSGHCQDGSGVVSPDVDPECFV
ncbi:Metacaspase-1A [Fusarium oxysporum f. sp. albedinis]|nr:Uncharacterized protein HZ326_28603 [Fusarium oxysporum f. sp. albedinis]KAJ0137607.1 Metacaspase-1A [Fusarium oxysporum f. sp. albedinis]